MIRPTILWALSLAMLGGALFGLAFSLRPPAGRAYPGALRRLSAKREVRALSPASRLGVAGDGRSKRPSPPLKWRQSK